MIGSMRASLAASCVALATSFVIGCVPTAAAQTAVCATVDECRNEADFHKQQSGIARERWAACETKPTPGSSCMATAQQQSRLERATRELDSALSRLERNESPKGGR